MTNTMNAILERILSEEIAKQEMQSKEDITNGFSSRDNIIKEIKDFMKENDIKFRQDFYLDTIREIRLNY